ncbi:hypothetical protein Tco_0127955 [Tanacetum coccineum]
MFTVSHPFRLEDPCLKAQDAALEEVPQNVAHHHDLGGDGERDKHSHYPMPTSQYEEGSQNYGLYSSNSPSVDYPAIGGGIYAYEGLRDYC